MLLRLFRWLFATNYPIGTCIYKYTTRLSGRGNRLIDKQIFLRIVGWSPCGKFYLCRRLDQPGNKQLLRINRLRRWIAMSPSWAIQIPWNTYFAWEEVDSDPVAARKAFMDWWFTDESKLLETSEPSPNEKAAP